jgi:hypothetical protein
MGRGLVKPVSAKGEDSPAQSPIDRKGIDLYDFLPFGDVAEWLKAAVC